MKKPPTCNKRSRPRAAEVIAKSNHKVDQFFQKRTPQVDASMPLHPAEEEKKHTGYLRVQVVEESKQGAFMTA